MIIKHHHNKYCDEDVVYIWIDEVLPPDFERRLLMELLALAGPRRFGSTEAPGRNADSIDAVIDEGLRKAVQKHSFHREYWFDYVNGYRLKVEYLPCGYAIFEDSSDIRRRNPGMPLVVSSEFHEMYGDDALAGMIERAFAIC